LPSGQDSGLLFEGEAGCLLGKAHPCASGHCGQFDYDLRSAWFGWLVGDGKHQALVGSDLNEVTSPVDGVSVREHHLSRPGSSRLGDEVEPVQRYLHLVTAEPASEVLWCRPCGEDGLRWCGEDSVDDDAFGGGSGHDFS